MKPLYSLSFTLLFSSLLYVPTINANITDDLELLDISDFAYVEEKKSDSLEAETRAPVSIITNITHIAALYDTDITQLHKSTAPARSRNPVYLPTFWIAQTKKLPIDLQLTFQMHTNMVYPFKDRIHFDFISPDATEFIHNTIDGAVPGSSALYDEGIALFQQMSIQERRGIFTILFEIPLHDRLFFRSDLSLIGMERNYWLNEKLQKKGLDLFKKIETVFETFAPSNTDISTNQVKELLEQIPCKFGFGDPRLQLGYTMFSAKYLETNIGLECIPPLSALTEKSVKIPENEENSLIGEIHRINRINRKPVLGSGGHWGLGGFLEAKVPLFEGAFDIFTKMSFDKILAKEVVRDIPINKEIFPRLIAVESLPGDIVHLLCGLRAHHKEWHLGLGYDFYQQAKESLSFASGAKNIENANLAKACQQEATHHSFFSSIVYALKKEEVEWLYCGLNGSVSFKEQGIGSHWNVGLNVRFLL